MRSMRSSVVLATWLSLAVAGCATPSLYPICYYNTQPSRGEAAKNSIALANTLRASLGKDDKHPVGATDDGRWLASPTTARENKQLAQIWGRIGCIGDSLDSFAEKQQHDCAQFVSRFVLTRTYNSIGNARDAGGIDIWNEALDHSTVVHCSRAKE